MQNRFLVVLMFYVLAVGLKISVCYAQTYQQPSSANDRLRSAVQSYVNDPSLPNKEPTSYIFAFVDLVGKGKREAIVYLTSMEWCGSSGCTMLVLAQEDSSYKVISKIPAVQLPIRVLESKSHGWHDLSISIRGGGVPQGYEETVRFNGKKYVESSVAAEERSVHQMKGKIVLWPKDKEIPLYP